MNDKLKKIILWILWGWNACVRGENTFLQRSLSEALESRDQSDGLKWHWNNITTQDSAVYYPIFKKMQTKWTQSLTYELQKALGAHRTLRRWRPAYAKYKFQASQGYIQTVSKPKPNKKKKMMETI